MDDFYKKLDEIRNLNRPQLGFASPANETSRETGLLIATEVHKLNETMNELIRLIKFHFK